MESINNTPKAKWYRRPIGIIVLAIVGLLILITIMAVASNPSSFEEGFNDGLSDEASVGDN